MRDYFKSPFYADNNAVFISETGYMAPIRWSRQKFIPADKLWRNATIVLGVPYAHGYPYRISDVQAGQEEFNFEPDNLEDFTIASQIVQVRRRSSSLKTSASTSGRRLTLWWNVMDCLAVLRCDVDYYFDKLVYGYLKRPDWIAGHCRRMENLFRRD